MRVIVTSNKNSIIPKICLFIYILSGILNSTIAQNHTFKVVLDPGHGGKDPGSCYADRKEKDIALKIALKVGKILESQPKYTVIYTRVSDVFIELIDRAGIANKANADIFVSIHCNASKNKVATGTETYVMGMNKIASNLAVAQKENSVITLEKDYKQKYDGFDPNSPETMIGMILIQEQYLENSIYLAGKIEEGFSVLGKKIRHGGVKQAPFMVLHKAYMPRVLIEVGFISNEVEGNLLNSDDGQNEFAKTIANAINEYKKEFFDSEVAETTISNQKTEGVKYRVQVVVSLKKIAPDDETFVGLKNIYVIYEDNVYKYMYGDTSNYKEAKRKLKEAKEKGLKSAFIVAYNNGLKISVQEAQKL